MQYLHTPSTRLVALGGMLALILAMGVGRFAYTPLLPIMQQHYSFGADTAGGIAVMNYGGYLLGALLCMTGMAGRWRVALFRSSLVFSIATTAAMGLFDSLVVWLVLRFTAGIASAGVMVLGSAIALDSLAWRGAGSHKGIIYSGVGAGMGLSGIIVLALAERLDPREIWLWLALLCLPLAAASWRWVGGAARPSQAHDGARSRDSASKSTPFLPWLVAAYFCEGLGYIVSGTFLSAIVQANLASNTAGAATWIVAGLAAAASTIFWPGWAARWGEVRALVAAYALQALGILLPALSPDVTAAYVGAALFGGTFMGIAALVMGLGQQLAPQQSARVLGLLTAAFGIGQIIGPMLAGLVAERTASFTLPLMGAAAVVTAGGVLLMIGARRRIIYRANVVTEHAMK